MMPSVRSYALDVMHQIHCTGFCRFANFDCPVPLTVRGMTCGHAASVGANWVKKDARDWREHASKRADLSKLRKLSQLAVAFSGHASLYWCASTLAIVKRTRPQ